MKINRLPVARVMGLALTALFLISSSAMAADDQAEKEGTKPAKKEKADKEKKAKEPKEKKGPKMPEKGSKQYERMLKTVDKDGNGEISQEEWDAHVAEQKAKREEMNKAMDTDGDGKVSKEERKAYRDKMKAEKEAKKAEKKAKEEATADKGAE